MTIVKRDQRVTAGQRDRRVGILAATRAENEAGEEIETWSVSGYRWASKEDLSGSELFRAQQVNAEITTRFGFAYTDQITVANRIQYEGKDYDIYSVAEVGRREGLIVLAKARVQ